MSSQKTTRADGNSEVVPYSNLRPLASQFKSLEGQAKEATLSFVNLLDWRTEYGQDAMDRFRELCEVKKNKTPFSFFFFLFAF